MQTPTPDVEKAAIAFLVADDDVAAICDGRVRGVVAGPYPMLRVVRAGGPSSRRLDRPLLYIDAYGDEPDKAAQDERERLHLLSRTAIASLFKFETTGPFEGCDVSNVAIVTAHQWLPDPLTRQGRYHNAVVLHTRTPKT